MYQLIDFQKSSMLIIMLFLWAFITVVTRIETPVSKQKEHLPISLPNECIRREKKMVKKSMIMLLMKQLS